MVYLVTGGTGFIGRHLIGELVERHDGDVHVVVRPGSEGRLRRIAARTSAPQRVHAVHGDLTEPLLGVAREWIREHAGRIDHLFHLAAIYDMTASAQRNEQLNVEGTRHAVELAGELRAGTLHHVSSVAVAGDYRGTFTEEMFDEGQDFPSPYHRTKFLAEQWVREHATVPWRVYRPSIVVGHSETGAMDKVDGPYYFFPLLRRFGTLLPRWLPLVAPELGATNIVPVDFVARALDHLAHRPGLDKQAFHLAHPRPQPVTRVLSTLAHAAGGPTVKLPVGLPGADRLPELLGRSARLPGLRELLTRGGVPPEVVAHVGFPSRFDTTVADGALADRGITVPEFDDYAQALWQYWARALDPALRTDKKLRAAVHGKKVVITGASSGIGHATAVRIALSGGIPLLVARGREKLAATLAEIEDVGAAAHVYPCDLSDLDAIGELAGRIAAEHDTIAVVVNNAGRSIRRSLALSTERFHDFERTMQLNYFGAIKLVTELLPQLSAGGGHVVNVSSIGVQTSPPRFSAYVASKAALEAWTRTVSSELLGDGITFTNIHMPLVRTPMIAPTKIYDSFPTITPEQAAGLVRDAIVDHPKTISTPLGTFGEVSYALTPKIVDRVLHTAYKVFGDSAAARGEQDPQEHASREQRILAALMRGVHW